MRPFCRVCPVVCAAGLLVSLLSLFCLSSRFVWEASGETRCYGASKWTMVEVVLSGVDVGAGGGPRKGGDTESGRADSRSVV
jgi:hypothetical protein